MSGYTGQTPDTERPTDWRCQAACLGKWALMHPDNDESEIAVAKAVCARCPVQRDCFFDAIHTGDMQHGIRAGLRPNERRAVAKELKRREAEQQQPILPKPPTVLRPRSTYPSLRHLFDANTKRVIYGHLAWTGPAKAYFKGRSYNPKQVAFIVDRGRQPVGRVLTTCSLSGCVLPSHIGDDAERAGTRLELAS